jgi:hypothetical protein
MDLARDLEVDSHHYQNKLPSFLFDFLKPWTLHLKYQNIPKYHHYYRHNQLSLVKDLLLVKHLLLI